MSVTEQLTAEQVAEQREALVGRIFQSALGLLEVFSINLGDRLGLYQALADAGWLTTAELAERTATNERYAREWLEQQAVAGLLDVDDASAEPAARRYRLPPGHREVLLDRDSLAYLGPLARLGASVGLLVPDIAEAFRTGGGVPWSAFGPDGRETQAALNRPVFLNLLTQDWLPQIPDVHARLQSSESARVADLGCGGGWSSIAIARGYPNARVDGFDVDEPSLELARANAAEAELAARVQFHHVDASSGIDRALDGAYDLVCLFEMVHDLARPVEVLGAARRLAGDRGAVIVMDERTGETFAAPSHEMERLYYAASLFCCLPVGMSEQPSAATGTVMRPSTLRGYAREAGFRDVAILPIEHDFFRFYRLVNFVSDRVPARSALDGADRAGRCSRAPRTRSSGPSLRAIDFPPQRSPA
jgi:2-polyprenyl-3-methyl-5-hydroxy-6-metoxy-1,4-benzoquinol methylase